MFNNNSKVEDGTSLVGEGLTIEGDLICNGSIDIAGIMNGNLKAQNLKILETGSIIGKVNSSRLEIFGFIEGEIYADDVFIGKTAIIKGDIFFKENLKIDEGADVDGYIKRSKEAKKTSSLPVKKEGVTTKNKQLDIEDSKKKAVNQN